ncbi:MAG: phosphoenolpyruvate--protein phosphotransferase [Gammaproteobacteria bacterium]|nr:phosphoenolpyruvate--protein phosphotransferase [Gammaproteobacteria bacterium]
MLNTLRKLITEVSAAQNLEEALTIIVKRVKQTMHTDVCSVYLTDPLNEERVLMATDGLLPEAIGKVRLARYEGLVGLVCERAEPINIDNAPEHPRYKYFPETGEEQYSSFLGVPIINHGQTLGTLVVQDRHRRRYAEEEVTLLLTLAAQLSGAIAHAQASGRIQMGQRKRNSGGDKPFRGLAGAPGVAIGVGVVVYAGADLDAVPNRYVTDIDAEVLAFENAVAQVRTEMAQLRGQLQHIPAEDRAIFDAYQLMLESDSLIKQTVQKIRRGNWAPGALRETIHEHARVFAGMDDAYLRERAQDIRDLGLRILSRLQSKETAARTYPQQVILVSEDLSPTMMMEVPSTQLMAIVSARGSGSSHVAILARAMGIPAVMGVEDLPTGDLNDVEIVVDGFQGFLFIRPSPTVLREYKRLRKEESALTADLLTLKDQPAVTLDGYRLPMYANTGLLADIRSSLGHGAEGVGLYRTEIPYMVRDRFPGEQEQAQVYRKILEAFAPKPVYLRTLDIGGDKNLSYFPIQEANPFLGWRGIRVSLDQPEIFIVQIRAMLRSAVGLNNLNILLPMITTVEEVVEAQRLIRRVHHEILEEEKTVIEMPRVGVMIEVPSAVYQIKQIAKRCDFISIGTNDLVQYLLAVDRNNRRVAALYDCLHPAVIQAVIQVVEGAHALNKPVSICGEMASDPAAVILLIAMGLDSLSMNAVNIPRVKWVIRNFSRDHTQRVLDEVLRMDGAEAIRRHLNATLENAGLGGLIRAGK